MRAASDLLGRLLILPSASGFNHRYRGHGQLGRVAPPAASLAPLPSADPDTRDRVAQVRVAGPDADGAPRAGPGAHPDGSRATRGGEVERVVADQYRGSLDVEADLASHVGAGRAVAVDRAELQPGGVRAVAVDLGIVSGQRQYVVGGVRGEGPRRDLAGAEVAVDAQLGPGRAVHRAEVGEGRRVPEVRIPIGVGQHGGEMLAADEQLEPVK